MQSLFSQQYAWLWMIALAAALFFPVRRLIWVLTVRHAIRKGGEESVDTAEQQRLLRRAGVTSALLCFLFSFFYIQTLFR